MSMSTWLAVWTFNCGHDFGNIVYKVRNNLHVLPAQKVMIIVYIYGSGKDEIIQQLKQLT
jgi:hypothetical protein